MTRIVPTLSLQYVPAVLWHGVCRKQDSTSNVAARRFFWMCAKAQTVGRPLHTYPKLRYLNALLDPALSHASCCVRYVFNRYSQQAA
jgi:hypothetical protein